ncbi:MAG TPA: acyl-CoA hydrolase [Pseudonocardiaceae bacterium]|jgi:3-aminobutyryl-CoA ammonia-lyase|nr:acyl-CoA hydrolase [Pseudonocardiaceae bacterium]
MTLVVGFSVTHRRYVAYSAAHYRDALVEGAYCLGLFGEVATELAIRTDGDESLLAGYSSVELLAPVRAGDVLEASATLRRIGTRSRDLDFEARVVCRANPKRGPSAAEVLSPALVVARAVGTIVVPGTTLNA